jgi:hypothetical protein
MYMPGYVRHHGGPRDAYLYSVALSGTQLLFKYLHVHCLFAWNDFQREEPAAAPAWCVIFG